MDEATRKYYHDAEYRRELIYNSINRLLKEHSMNQSQLVSVLRDDFGFTKMTPSLFSKMFSPNSSQKQTPDMAVICAIAEYFDVTVDIILTGGQKASMPYEIAEHLTYRQLCQLLFWMDDKRIIEMKREEKASGDPSDVKVWISPGDNADGALAHFLSMYTDAKESINTNTLEGKRTLEGFTNMMIKLCSDQNVFGEFLPFLP